MPEVDSTQDPAAEENLTPEIPASEIDTQATPVPPFVASFDANTQLWEVVDPATGAVVARNITDEAAAQETADLRISQLSTTSVPLRPSRAPVVPDYVISFNADTQLWDAVNPTTGVVIASFPEKPVSADPLGRYANSPELDANNSLAEAAAAPDPYADSPELDAKGSLSEYAAPAPNPYANGTPYDDEGNLNPGWTLDEENNPVFVGGGFVEPATQASAADSRKVAAATAEARKQQILLDQQRNLNNADWRVRLSLARDSDYLYNAADAGILSFLKPTNGVIFPYTPQIATSYKANYNHYDLTHSNQRGYFYQNSYTDTVTITGTFTAQNLFEANYLLAVIHFFRSVTKMFYGQSQNLGSPPPVCYLNGLGEYQFNKHPVLVTSFNYTLPNSVDYIRAGSANNLQLNQNPLRAKTNTANPALSSVQRLANAFLNKGASQNVRPPPTQPNKNNPTYVPTRMDIVVTLMPIQSRTKATKFNLQTFANGPGQQGGYW